MPEPDPRISELENRLDSLVRTQIDFQKEISFIRAELRKTAQTAVGQTGTPTRPTNIPVPP
jgi:hypothetical protein